jgi:hypothetical protein
MGLPVVWECFAVSVQILVDCTADGAGHGIVSAAVHKPNGGLQRLILTQAVGGQSALTDHRSVC